MKMIFSKNRVSFQSGNGVAFFAGSKTAETYVEAAKERPLYKTPLPIFYGNERQHTGVFANV